MLLAVMAHNNIADALATPYIPVTGHAFELAMVALHLLPDAAAITKFELDKIETALKTSLMPFSTCDTAHLISAESRPV
jgi:hypothetical protein